MKTDTKTPMPGEIWEGWSGTYYITALNRSHIYPYLGKKKLDSKATYKLRGTSFLRRIGTFELDTVATVRLLITPRMRQDLLRLVDRKDYPELHYVIDMAHTDEALRAYSDPMDAAGVSYIAARSALAAHGKGKCPVCKDEPHPHGGPDCPECGKG